MYQLRLETLSLSGFSTLFCVDCLQHILGLFKKKFLINMKNWKVCFLVESKNPSDSVVIKM